MQYPPLMPRVAAAVAAVWALAGCASLAPVDTRPSLQSAAPSSWAAPLPHQGQATELQRWWAQFNDPLMDDLLAAAQQASPTLAAARTRVAEARVALAEAGAREGLGLDVAANVSRSRTTPGQPVATAGSVALQGRWEVDLWGSVAAGREAAQAQIESAQAGWHAARVAVAAETASTYVAWRACRAQSQVQRDDVASQQRALGIAVQAERAGTRAPTDTAVSRAALAQSQAQLAARQVVCDAQVKALVALTALPESALRSRVDAWPSAVPQPAQPLVPDVPATVLRQRPDVYQAEREWVTRAARLVQADAAQRPSVVLSGSIGRSRVSTAGLTSEGAVWSLGPLSITWPVLDGGSRRAAREAADVALDEARTRYLATLREAVREVEDALLQLDSLAAQRVRTREALEALEQVWRGTESRARAGLASTLELEDARRQTLQARQSLMDIELAHTQTWITLYRALGGGWNPENP